MPNKESPSSIDDTIEKDATRRIIAGKYWAGTEEVIDVALPKEARHELESRWQLLSAIATDIAFRTEHLPPDAAERKRLQQRRQAQLWERQKGSNTIMGSYAHGLPGNELAREDFRLADEQVRTWVATGEPLTAERIAELNTKIRVHDTEDRDLGIRRPGMPQPSTGLRGNGNFIDNAGAEEAMARVMDWYEKQKDVMHPIELSEKFLERFISLHPFLNGNRRTADVIMSWILESNGFPAVAVEKTTDKPWERFTVFASKAVSYGPQNPPDVRELSNASTYFIEQFQIDLDTSALAHLRQLRSRTLLTKVTDAVEAELYKLDDALGVDSVWEEAHQPLVVSLQNEKHAIEDRHRLLGSTSYVYKNDDLLTSLTRHGKGRMLSIEQAGTTNPQGIIEIVDPDTGTIIIKGTNSEQIVINISQLHFDRVHLTQIKADESLTPDALAKRAIQLMQQSQREHSQILDTLDAFTRFKLRHLLPETTNKRRHLAGS